MTMEDTTSIASATIELLEARLHRLSYLLTGDDDTDWTGSTTRPSVQLPPPKPNTLDETVTRRLARLERDLDKLSRNVPAVREALILCELGLPLQRALITRRRRRGN